MRAFFLLAFFLSTPAFAAPTDWVVSQKWTPALEKKFSEFLAKIGDSGCRTLDACLKSSRSNPFYAARTPQDFTYGADCADFPYALRMYFSWMEGLPFDYVSEVAQAEPEKETSDDLRYTKFGNRPAAWKVFKTGQVYNGPREMRIMQGAVSTATYRMHYDQISDFYPPSIDPAHIRPGTAVYDPAGHAAIIYKIEKDGRIRMMDAHPDYSVTRITFDKKFTRSRPAHGAGFKNWRPELNYKDTATLPGFSSEQFGQVFEMNGESLSYYDWVRAQMSGGNLSFHPVEEARSMMLEVCSNIHDREIAVNNAIRYGIQNQRHPDRLPRNIYGTNGDWEEYSTPSRDARLKVAFQELRQEVERFLKMNRERSPRILYKPAPSKYSNRCVSGEPGCFLAASIMSAYEEMVMSQECRFQYTKSDGTKKLLSYTDVLDRLFALSFDPYHCVELRWGASSQQELDSCRDDANKLAWYKAERGLRNQTERTYDARMDTDLGGTYGQGRPEAPDVDLWGFLGKQLK